MLCDGRVLKRILLVEPICVALREDPQIAIGFFEGLM